MRSETSNPEMTGQIYVSSEIAQFLINLVQPQLRDKVLCIGSNLGNIKTELQSLTGSNPTSISSHPNPEELKELVDFYDVVLCAPTFGLALEQDTGISSDSSEEFWLKWSIGHLKPKSRFVIIVPTGLLSNYSQQPIRKFIIEQSNLISIIQLPSGWAQGTALQASILLINADKSTEKIKMYRFAEANNIPWNVLATNIGRSDTETSTDFPGKAYTVTGSEINRVYQGLLIERPGIQSESKVMQAHADLHDYITRGVLP